MGFNIDVAEFGARKTGYRTVEEAVVYLTDKDEFNGLFVHDYVPFKFELCFICDHPRD